MRGYTRRVELKSIAEHGSGRPAGGGESPAYGRIEGGGIETHARTLEAIYEMEFTQISAGEMDMRVDFAATDRCVVYRECYQSRTQVLGALRPGSFAFALPLAERGTRWWGGIRDARMIPTALSGELIDARFAPGHSHIVVVLDRTALESALSGAGYPDPVVRKLREGRACRMMELRDEISRDLSEMFGRIADQAAGGGNGLTRSRLDRIALGGALSLLDGQADSGAGRGASRRLFLRAIEAYDEMGTHPNISELCVSLGVRPRTLQDAFQHCADASPHRFFLLRRLNRARRSLAAARAEETSVKAVAIGHGFHELGRFAVRYRSLFGESPSDTLGRKPQLAVSVPFLRM